MLLALLLAVSPFAYDQAAPLDVQEKPLEVIDGISKSAISFASPKGGRATGFLFTPKRDGRLPAILLMHGAPGNAAQLESRALFLARHGAIVLTLDAPFARRESRGFSLEAEVIRADTIQLAVDQMRAFDLLLARSDVDPQRLAYVGGSFGGAAGALLAGLDHRPKTYVLFVADGGLVEHFRVDGKWTGPLAEMPAAQNDEWARSLEDVMPMAWVAKATPGAIYFQSGKQDEMVPPTNAKRVQALAPQPKVQWYESGHKLPSQAQYDQLAWLHEKIGTDAPRPGDENGAPPLQQRK
jgi:dienelactone hydrolase